MWNFYIRGADKCLILAYFTALEQFDLHTENTACRFFVKCILSKTYDYTSVFVD